MERIRSDIRRTKAEPKNYIALNRKKICTKKSNPIQNSLNPQKTSNSNPDVVRMHRPEVTPGSELKRSIEQLASIISRGDLDKILQLARLAKTNRPDQQPNQLPSVPEPVLEQPQPMETREVKVVQPTSVPGLEGDRLKRVLKSDAPIHTAEIQPLPSATHQVPPITAHMEPHYGRGQGLRQLLELDSASSVPYSDPYPNVTGCIQRGHKKEEIEECYYPWGKPGAGAPSRPYFSGENVQRLDQMNTSTQQHQPGHSKLDAHTTQYIEPTNLGGEKKRKAFQYMLELQAQVKEKERLKREQQEKQSRLDRAENERIERERERMLVEAEKEKERISQGKKEARQRFQCLQAKIEEHHQLALRNRQLKFNRHTTSPSHPISPLSTQSVNTDAKSDTMVATVHSTKLSQKESVNVRGQKIAQRNASEQKKKSVQQGRIRNPPPSQLNVIKPSNRTHLLVRDKKSSSMPTIAPSEVERRKAGKETHLQTQDDCYSDVSKTSTVTSLDRTTSLTTVHTESQIRLVMPRVDKEEIFSGEKNQNAILQLQKLKQGLYVKQQEIHSEFF